MLLKKDSCFLIGGTGIPQDKKVPSIVKILQKGGEALNL